MSLISCPECQKQVSDKAKSCPNCGYPIELITPPIPTEEMCIYCGSNNPIGSDYCDSCGMRLTDYTPMVQKNSSSLPIIDDNDQLQIIQEKQLHIQEQLLEHEIEIHNSQAKCPRCGSISLSGNKKGFGIGKAVVGASFIGAFGLIAGNINSKKLIITCMNCGHRFKL